MNHPQSLQPTERRNPYVGPRTFDLADKDWYFGREGEARDLLSLVISERMTLFYAPSGAGKSSLLNVQLIPRLRDEAHYLVLPVGRVGGELPTGITDVDNIYTFNLLLSLEHQAGSDPSRFTQMNLQEFMAGLYTSDGVHYVYDEWRARENSERGNSESENFQPPHVLIIDQFEEIVTTHPGRWRERRAFFQQLAEAMRADPLLWVVLTLREDFVASLDPFARLVPGGMTNRFYMERMGVGAALEAIQRPAEKKQCPFAPMVAETLVDNLRQIQVHSQDENRLGQYLEPVQLQVVCYQLWEKLRAEKLGQVDPSIMLEDLARSGDVDNVLADFYEQAIEDVLAQEGHWLSERELRRWFEEQLITQADTRGTVYRGAKTAGMNDSVVELLQNRFLLRTEVRAGGKWVELVHDRFVMPIQQANQRWRNDYNNPLYRAYQRWQNQGQQNAQLLSGPGLAEAQRFADDNPLDVREEETNFLQRSQEAASEAAQSRRRNFQIAAIAISVLILLTGMAVLGFFRANYESQRAQKAAATAEAASTLAEERTRRALAENLAGQSQLLIHRDQNYGDLSLILARDAALTNLTTNADAALRLAFNKAPWVRTIPSVREQHEEAVISTVFHPNGEWVISGGTDGTIRIWQAADLEPVKLLFGHTDAVLSVAVSPDGEHIVSGSGDNSVRVWDMESGEQLALLNGHSNDVNAVAVSPDGERIVSGSHDNSVRVWDLESGEQLALLNGHSNDVNAVAVSPDGERIVSGSHDNSVRVWDLESGEQLALLNGHSEWVYAVAVSPDGEHIVSGSRDNSVRVWDMESGEQLALLNGHSGHVSAVAVSPDGQRIISGSWDNSVRVWDGPERLIRKAISRILRPAPILKSDERLRFGIGPDISLPDQKILQPWMDQAAALQLVDRGYALARTGAVNSAVASFEQALSLDANLDFDSQIKAEQALSRRIQALLFAGRSLANEADFGNAVTKFEEAATLDKTLNLDDLTAEAQTVATSILIEQGRKLAGEGDVVGSLLKFEEAKTLDGALDLKNLRTEAQAIKASTLVKQSHELASQGNAVDALSKVEQAIDIAKTLESVAIKFALCSLKKLESLAQAVVQSCNQVDEATPVVSGRPVTGTVNDPFGDLWALDITSSSWVTITLSRIESGRLDTYLALYNSDFQLIAEHDDIELGVIQDSELLNLELTKPGRYLIQASRCCPDDDQYSVGDYVLEVTATEMENRVVEMPPAHGPLPLTTPIPQLILPLATPTPHVQSPLATPTVHDSMR